MVKNKHTYIDEEQEPKVYTNTIDLYDDIELLLQRAPKDKRKKEYRDFLIDYKRLADLYNGMVGFKCFKNKI